MYSDWMRIKKEIDRLKVDLLTQEKLIYLRHKDILEEKDEGVVKITDGNWVLRITQKLTRAIDQEGAEHLGGLGMSVKYGWSKTEYNKLSDVRKLVVDAVVTSKPGKPSFSVTEVSE